MFVSKISPAAIVLVALKAPTVLALLSVCVPFDDVVKPDAVRILPVPVSVIVPVTAV